MQVKTILKNPSTQKILKISLLAIFLLISYSFVYRKEKESAQDPLSENNKRATKIFSNSEGNPILAIGNCNEISDCIPTGCSSQICSDHSVTTTCELGEFPEKETYSCGCQNGKCVWYRYR